MDWVPLSVDRNRIAHPDKAQALKTRSATDTARRHWDTYQTPPNAQLLAIVVWRAEEDAFHVRYKTSSL